MRLFVALPVRGDARAELERKLVALRRTDWPVKWVREEGLHLTLKFLGEVEQERLTAIRAALDGAVRGTPALHFTPTELGAFPSLSRARVLWAGYHTEPALELLVHRVEQATERLGFPGEGRPFHAHVTLGRVRDRARLPREGLGGIEHEALTGEFTANRLVLYQSRPGPAGPVYDELESFALDS
jgi:2'-5' RNA ligase